MTVFIFSCHVDPSVHTSACTGAYGLLEGGGGNECLVNLSLDGKKKNKNKKKIYINAF